jgi:hypothetical protein
MGCRWSQVQILSPRPNKIKRLIGSVDKPFFNLDEQPGERTGCVATGTVPAKRFFPLDSPTFESAIRTDPK